MTEFDPDLSRQHETNKKAAEERRLKYDRRLRQYVDEDGCPAQDRFGQDLG